MRRLRPLLSLPLLFARPDRTARDLPLLDGRLPALGGGDIELAAYAGRVLLVVNSASHCGFTGQFRGLERLYREYRAQGLEILAVPSDDFRQEAADAAQIAAVCQVRYGVEFAVSAPQHVAGAQACELFRRLAARSAPPRWNFYKYLIGRDGELLARFSSRTSPDAAALRQALERALAAAP